MLSAQDLDSMQEVTPFRNRKLFSEFLPSGYRMTTLSSVKDRETVIHLKVILGTLITLYDDLADRPEHLNSKLLQLLYRIPFERIDFVDLPLNAEEKRYLHLVNSLFKRLFAGMSPLANYAHLIELFYFDLKQFFLANRYSELLSKYPHLINEPENRLYLHHNMGIVMAGMIDLMSLPHFDISELSHARALFLLGQRAGRISNVLTTFGREQLENDKTNELFAISENETFSSKCERLNKEIASLFQQMDGYNNIQSFSAMEYRLGMQALHELHIRLKNVI